MKKRGAGGFAIRIPPLDECKVGDYINREQIRSALMEKGDVVKVTFTEYGAYVTKRASGDLYALHFVDIIVPERGLKRVAKQTFAALPEDIESSFWE